MKYYGITNSGNDFLEHHGILGQKWGKQNGPPYPLGSDDHSGKEVSLAKKTGTKIGKSSGLGHHGGAAQIQNGKHYKYSSNSDEAKKAKRKQTLKKVAIGAAVVVGAAAITYVVAHHGNSAPPQAVQSSQTKPVVENLIKNFGNASADSLRGQLESGKVTISDKEYRHMVNTEMQPSTVDDVNKAFDEATKWNYLMDKYGGKSLSDVEVNKTLRELTDKYAQSSSDVLIAKKGQKLHRIGFGNAGRNFDLSKVNGPLYVTNNERDRKTYIGVLKNRQDPSDDTTYDIGLKAMKNIYSPGKSKRVEYFSDLYKNNSGYRESLKNLTTKSWSGSDDDFRDMLRKGEGEKAFRKASWSIVKSNTDASKLYIDRVKKDGYHALLDDFDINAPLGKTPTILLDAKNDTKVAGRKKISALLKNKYYNYYYNTAQSDWKLDPERFTR